MCTLSFVALFYIHFLKYIYVAYTYSHNLMLNMKGNAPLSENLDFSSCPCWTCNHLQEWYAHNLQSSSRTSDGFLWWWCFSWAKGGGGWTL